MKWSSLWIVSYRSFWFTQELFLWVFLGLRQTPNLGSLFSHHINCMLCKLLFFFITLYNYMLLPCTRITLTVDQSHLASFSITIPKQMKPTRKKKLQLLRFGLFISFLILIQLSPLPNVFVVVVVFPSSSPRPLYSECFKCFFSFLITYVTANHP